MIRSSQHLKFIRSLPCVITNRMNVEAAHIRRGNDGGTGIKPSDCFVVPLSQEEHARQHQIGELKFWYPYGGYETASVMAKALYENSGDYYACVKILQEWRNAFHAD